MTRLAIRRIFAYSIFFWLLIIAQTRPLNSHSTLSPIAALAAPFDWSAISFKSPAKAPKTGDKPYHISISGKKLRVKSYQPIKSIMVWTSKGDRVLEQKDLIVSSMAFDLNVAANGYYVLIQMENGKSYTERF